MFKFQIWKFVPLILIITAGILATPTSSDPFLLPKVEDGSEPAIDGTITFTEWMNSIIFNTTIDGQDAQLRVTSDDSNLYIGFNFTYTDFVPVNDTSYNSTAKMNLDTHDWLAFQFDNNLDQKNLGTTTSPDDVVVFNQFINGSYDGYSSGNASYPFYMDAQNNGEFAFANSSNSVVYEFSKPHSITDVNGSDINQARNIYQLKVNNFLNQTSNSTTFSSTEWFTFRVNSTGTGLALESVGNTTINFNLIGSNIDNFKASDTTFNQYGFDLNTKSGNLSINTDGDLNILVLGDDAKITDTQLENLVAYTELGGKLMIFLSPESSSSSKIAELFGLEYLSNSVLTGINDTALSFAKDELNSFRFLSQNTTVTDRKVEELTFSSAAFNMSSVLNRTKTPYLFRQDFQMKNIFTATDFVYDDDDNGTIDGDEKFNNELSLGVTVDLLKGGRAIIFASNSILSDEYLTENDNIDFLLRMMPWNARLVDTIEINSVELDTHVVNKTESISITVNATDAFGNVITGLTVRSELRQANSFVMRVDMTSTESVFTGSVNSSLGGSMQIFTIAFIEGYGFAEGERKEVLFANRLNPFNDLSKLAPLIVAMFALSLVLVIFTILRTKKL